MPDISNFVQGFTKGSSQPSPDGTPALPQLPFGLGAQQPQQSNGLLDTAISLYCSSRDAKVDTHVYAGLAGFGIGLLTTMVLVIILNFVTSIIRKPVR